MAATLDLYPTDADAAAGGRVMVDNPSLTALYGPLPSPTAAGIGVLKTVMMGSLFAAFLAFALVRRHTRTRGGGRPARAARRRRRRPARAAGRGGLARDPAVLAAAPPLGAEPAAARASTPPARSRSAPCWPSAGLVMTGVTAVAVQLTTTTRGAAGIALGVLGAGLRRPGGGRHRRPARVRDLGWLSFLGWAEKVSPFGANRLWLLLPARRGSPALLLGLADLLLHRRDLGSGLWAARPGPAGASPRLGHAAGPGLAPAARIAARLDHRVCRARPGRRRHRRAPSTRSPTARTSRRCCAR